MSFKRPSNRLAYAFGLNSRRERKRVDVRPEYEEGRIRLPPLPPAWIDASEEFLPGVYGDGARDAQLGPMPGDDPVRVSSTTVRLDPPVNGRAGNGSPTVPLPRPTVDYQVPVSLAGLQAALAGKLDEARALIRAMKERTGMRFVLDRQLNVVVSLKR